MNLQFILSALIYICNDLDTSLLFLMTKLQVLTPLSTSEHSYSTTELSETPENEHAVYTECINYTYINNNYFINCKYINI